jgi:retron-type reverse transcriptase
MSRTGQASNRARFPLRGANWNNAGNAGLATLNLNNSRGNVNNNIGFRPASGHLSGPEGAQPRLRIQRPAERMPDPRRKPKQQHRAARRVQRTGMSRGHQKHIAMPRTISGLFDQVASFDALHAAYLVARKGKRRTMACRRFEQDLEGNLVQLVNELAWGQYRTGPYRHFDVLEPKRRQIAALTQFRDRVVQQALRSALEPAFELKFIADSFACRHGKGAHAGAHRTQAMMRECLARHSRLYALKADVRRYFASIDHAILKRLLRRRIADRRILALLDEIIDSFNTSGTPGKGLPLGNLTSQLLANVYLDALDQHVKCALGERWYVRYMDDFVVLSSDKARLQALRLSLQVWLAQNLSLETNHKTAVFPIGVRNGRGLDFLGYHLWPHRRRLRKASINRFRRRLRAMQRRYAQDRITRHEIAQRIVSWVAHARHGDALPIARRILAKAIFRRSAA